MEFSKKVWTTTGLIALAVSFITPAAVAVPASGVGDVTSAMIYENTAGVTVTSADRNDADFIIGQVLTDITDEDDDYDYVDSQSTVPGPTWAMNFFGNKYDSLCVTTNGAIVPTNEADQDCTDDYDDSLAALAAAANGPLIAAFSNDGDPDNDVTQTLDLAITSGSFSNDVLRLDISDTTSLTDGENYCAYVYDQAIDNGLDTELTPVDEFWGCGAVGVNSGSITFSDSVQWYASAEEDFDEVDILLSSGDLNFTSGASFYAVLADEDMRIDETSDGFGVVAEIYAGNAVIDGRDAYVVTYYRVPQYDNENLDALTNTYQIVLLKSDTGSDETGWDFDIMYNYGSIQDGDDGYEFGTYASSCDSFEVACRTGVGVVDYQARTGISNVFELFPDTPSRDLIDWRGTSALTQNSLNSVILGRYTFAFVGGEPADFAVPVMNGSGETAPRPEPLDPLAANPVAASEVVPGDSSCYEPARQDTCSVTVAPTGDANGISFENGWELILQATDGSGPAPLNSEGQIEFTRSELAAVSGTGFDPETEVRVFLFSDPTLLGTTTTDENGDFSEEFEIDPSIEAGEHTLQVNGIQGGTARSLNLGVLVVEGGVQSASPFDGPIVETVTPGESAPGIQRTLSGQNLDLVTSAYVDGEEVTIVSTSDNSLIIQLPSNLEAGVYDLLLVYSGGATVTVQRAIVIVASAASTPVGFKAWTKRLAEDSVKFYAKNPVGAGKVQFILNGEEIAWVNAVDELDPKLRVSTGSPYLVRTVDLPIGKNRVEILLDGERVFRATYVNNGE